jgi:hypothetical protein
MVNHLSISWKTLLTVFSNIIGLGLLTIILVLSANKTTSALSFIDFGRSLIYSESSNDPSTDPCGTPCLINLQLTFIAFGLNTGTYLLFYHNYEGIVKSKRNELHIELGRRKQRMCNYMKKPLENQVISRF